MENYFKKLDEYIFSQNPQKEEIEISSECKHYIIAVDGFETCNKCGVVLRQIFKTESNDFKFYEDKPKIKSSHDQLRDIRIHFINYINHRGTPQLSSEQYKNLESYLFKYCNSFYIGTFKKKYLTDWMKKENIDKIHFPEIYSHIILKNKENKEITVSMCNEIFNLCGKFILFFKGRIKNISKKILVYNIVKWKYNIELEDYIGGTTKKTKEKYKKYCDEFFNSIIYESNGN